MRNSTLDSTPRLPESREPHTPLAESIFSAFDELKAVQREFSGDALKHLEVAEESLLTALISAKRAEQGVSWVEGG